MSEEEKSQTRISPSAKMLRFVTRKPIIGGSIGTLLLLLGLTGFLVSADSSPKTKMTEALVGTKPEAWHATDWMQSDPLTLEDLRANVVLVRWWTGPGCPYCTASAPALNAWHKKYKDKGLKVIGLYHHKARFPLSKQWVRSYVDQELGFDFPIAIDPQWKTLRAWWLSHGKADWTSVTFLLDRQGVIRMIHPGGKYEKGDPAYKKLHQKIKALLREPPQTPSQSDRKDG